MKSPGLAIVASVVLLAFSGCMGQPTLDLGQPGKSLTYVPGSPSFDLEAAPEDAEGGVQVSISIPSTSLTFLKGPAGFEAHLEIDVRALVPRRDTLLNDYAWSDTIFAATYEETTREQSWLISRTLKFKAGSAMIVVELMDDATGKKEVRTEYLRIPSAAELRPFLGRIILQARRPDGGWATIVPMHFPSNLPDVRASARIFGLLGNDRDTATALLLRFKFADAIPQPPYYYSDFLPSAGEPRSIWFDKPDTVRHEQGIPTNDSQGKPLVTMDLRNLRPGLYRVMMHVPAPLGEEKGDTVFNESRVFSIKSPTFPRPSTLQELIEPMTYLLNPRERNRLRNATTLNDAHDVFDSLWISFRPSKERAAALIKRYYTRVEEANKLYTDLKEGWKTDRGMLYVILGPPQDIMNSLDRQIWTYDLPGTSQQAQFIFRRVIVGEGDVSIQTYVLYRDASYEWAWEQMVNQWRQGGNGW